MLFHNWQEAFHKWKQRYILAVHNSIMTKLFIFFVTVLLAMIPSVSKSQTKTAKVSKIKVDSLKVKQGEKIYKRNCSTCHHFEKQLIAASLKNVMQRHTKEWIFEYISDDAAFMKNDTTARRLNKQGDAWVTSHHFKEQISKKDFDKLIYFLENRKK
jgi:cytochrome c2